MLTLLAFLVLSPALAAEDASTDRATRLAALRAEVETLRADVARDRADLDARLADLDVRKREIELEADRERLALERLQLTVQGTREEAGDADGRFDGLKPVLLSGIATLRARIEAGLPYRLSERLASLEQLETQVRSDELSPDRGASRLWQLVEDELALSKENAIDRQVISLDGDERLVDVARLGMVAMYWKSEDGENGWAERTDAGFVWKRSENRTQRAQIDALFEALERRIRTGFFELPAFPEAK
jgi:hypothetical protein